MKSRSVESPTEGADGPDGARLAPGGARRLIAGVAGARFGHVVHRSETLEKRL